jgi:hypothetical protein
MMLYENVNKILNWGVKLASLAVTAPATWIVATQLFNDIQSPLLLFVMRFSAVFLIEGVMLSNWLLLEFDRSATPEIKARYGLTALAMYIALLVIGWKHEGPTGLVFRLALLAALLGSGWDTYVYTWQKATAKADKDISATRAVRHYRRKLAIADAKEALTVGFDLLREQRVVDKAVQLEVIKSDKQERLTLLSKHHEFKLSELEETFVNADKNRGKKVLPAPLTRSQAVDKMLDIYRTDPSASLREVGDKIGRSHQTVSDYLDELVIEGKVCRNGNGVQVTE